MKRRRVGQTSLEVTEIGFGCAPIGGLYRSVARADAMAVLEDAWTAGIRTFDVAPFYGHGLAERRVGDFLRDKPQESFVLSTKVGRILSPVPQTEVPDHGYVGALPFRIDYDYGYDAIMRSLEASFARLGLSRIDILFVHDIGAYTHGAELTRLHLRQFLDSGQRALEELKSGGTIAAYGLGVNEVPVCLDILSRAPLDCILLAGRYTLLDRAAERELVPLCRRIGTTLMVGGVFNSGILATGAVPGAHFDYGPAPAEVISAVRALEATAEAHQVSLAAAALAFPLRDTIVSSVLIGTAKRTSLKRNLDLLGTSIQDAAWAGFETAAINR